MRKKTHEEYEQELFGREIDYWPIERYVNSTTKILHECVEGHQWPVTPNSIIRGSGCPDCSSKRSKRSHENYLAELLTKNISYRPLEQYVNNKTKLIHECLEKHQWSAVPGHVLSGSGCPVCSLKKKKTHEEYLAELSRKNIHYIPTQPYINAKTKILHKCPEESHPEWYTRPNDILSGYGCPTCSKPGFDPSKSAKLYFFSFEHDEITYYKVGITNRSTQERHSKDWKRLKAQLLWELDFEVGYHARKLEKQIISDNNMYLINTEALTSGNTETFTVYIEPPKLADVV